MRVTENLYCRLGRAVAKPIGVNLRVYPLVGASFARDRLSDVASEARSYKKNLAFFIKLTVMGRAVAKLEIENFYLIVRVGERC